MTFSQWCKRIKEKCETNCPECPLNKGGGNGRSCCDLIDDEAYEMTACEVISLMGALKDRHHVWLREQKAKEVAMTDEQIDKWEEQTREIGGLGQTAALTLTADLRRLRDLEQVCRGYFHLDSVTGDAYPPTYLRTASEDAALVTIGRLLEGDK